MVCLDRRQVGFALSVPVSPGLPWRMQEPDEAVWHPEREDEGALCHRAVRDYLPDGAIDRPDGVVRRLRCIAIRISRRQGSPFADGEAVKRFCVVTNRDDPESGEAGALEHAHDVLTNELAAAALPSRKFGAHAAWFRLNVVLYNLLSAFKRLGLPGALHRIRPKRLRFLVLNTPARLICHARERVLRFAAGFARTVPDRFRGRLHIRPTPLPA